MNTSNMWRMSPATQQGQGFEEGVISLTENSNVKVLELLSYTRVDLMALREVYWNDMSFTIVLFLWEGSGVMGSERGKGEEGEEGERGVLE